MIRSALSRQRTLYTPLRLQHNVEMLCRRPVQQPVACTSPWLQGAGRASDYRAYQFQARAFHWTPAGAFHDGRVCLYGYMQVVDTKCADVSFAPYPDYLRHLAVLRQVHGSGTSDAGPTNTVGFVESLAPRLTAGPSPIGIAAAPARATTGTDSNAHGPLDAAETEVVGAALLSLITAADALGGNASSANVTERKAPAGLPIIFLGGAANATFTSSLGATRHLVLYHEVRVHCLVALRTDVFQRGAGKSSLAG